MEVEHGGLGSSPGGGLRRHLYIMHVPEVRDETQHPKQGNGEERSHN
jgi:hypothetical protein